MLNNQQPIAEKLPEVQLRTISFAKCDRGCMHCASSLTPNGPVLDFGSLKRAVEMFPSKAISFKVIISGGEPMG